MTVVSFQGGALGHVSREERSEGGSAWGDDGGLHSGAW